ncbi:AAA family ATPase [Neorhizobium sp. NCHU2750]|uniref:ATP-binding protein n=1 Tax=Neorhizobium sp. NCHU2750 TaxID=1825976 RepID=UPI000E74B248|nr:LuxR family transcriptional regulator [Neorhizobium sp. NCHU2750]
MLLEREAITEALLSTLADASLGRGRVVVLEGEPGIGKTALLQHFCALVDDHQSVHWGWNDPFTTPRPLGPLQDMATTIESDLGDLLRQAAAPDVIFTELLNTMIRSRRPMVLIFEDLHWADRATLDLIRFLGRRVSLLKAVIVLTIRDADVDREHPVTQLLGDLPASAVTRLSMMPLSRAAVAILAGDPEKGYALHGATGGNPFFVMELLADGDPIDGHLPVSIRDAVWARLSRLPTAIREFLDTISILPSGVFPQMIPLLMGNDAQLIADQCIDRGLLRLDEKGALIFRHELARQATVERLSPAVRRNLHLRVENMFASMPEADNDPAILSQRLHHAGLSGNSTHVLDLAPRAAAQAAMLGAHQQAATHLRAALDHVALAPPRVAAQIYEDWAHETFLAGTVSSEETMRAYTVAISLWRSQDDIRKVGLNLCRLARLHWRRGETNQAVAYTEQAVADLEAQPQSIELALAYSTRSQLLMLQDRFEESIVWGMQAIKLSEELGQIETRIHALNNVGTSLMILGRSGGDALLEESLSLSLKHGFHDHASRAFTNFSECCMTARDFAKAEKLIVEGTALCVQYDLDAAAHYLLGRHAQLRMEQGRFREAETIADGVIAKDGFPRVMHLPALAVLGRVKLRLGQAEGLTALNQALEEGLFTGEPQRIIPVRLALLEAAWLHENGDAARENMNAVLALGTETMSSWDLGEFLVWCRRCALASPDIKLEEKLPAPRAAELAGDFERAADLWVALEQPYEAALSLLQAGENDARRMLPRAVRLLDELEARQAAVFARRLALRFGLAGAMPRRRRGPYASARQHPLGLTRSEQNVLKFLVQGLSNKEIARKVTRSLRTVEHQVSSVLAKFNAGNRLEVLLRVRNEPWLVEQHADGGG